MEAKAKAAPAPKGSSKAEKKEPAAAPRKAEPAPATPEPEIPPPQDGSAEGGDAGDGAAGSCTDSLEHLKPFLIGGAVIAVGAILLGALLLARRN